MNIKIINANNFNQFGGVVHSDKKGNFKSLTIEKLRTSLPKDGENQFEYEPKFTPASGAVGNITLVSGVPGVEISVLNYTMTCSAASSIRFFSSGVNTAGTPLSGPMTIAANNGISANDNEVLFKTNKGESLTCTNSAGNIGGHLSYKLG